MQVSQQFERPYSASGMNEMPGVSREGGLVRLPDLGARRFTRSLSVAELAPPDRGEQVAQAVVVADRGVLVVRGGVAGLGGEDSGRGRSGLVVRDEHAAAARGDDLVAVEGEGGESPKVPAALPR